MDREDTRLADLLLGLSKRQSLGLGEEVTEEDAVVARALASLGEGVVGGSRSDKVSRNDLGSLVHELVERVLAVGSSCTPDDGL